MEDKEPNARGGEYMIKAAEPVDSLENVEADPGQQASADNRGMAHKGEFHLPPRWSRRSKVVTETTSGNSGRGSARSRGGNRARRQRHVRQGHGKEQQV